MARTQESRFYEGDKGLSMAWVSEDVQSVTLMSLAQKRQDGTGHPAGQAEQGLHLTPSSEGGVLQCLRCTVSGYIHVPGAESGDLLGRVN